MITQHYKGLLLSLVCLGLLGCPVRDPSSASSVDTLSRVLDSGKIRAGFFVQPPSVMRDPDTGEVFGTFVDAIKAIGDDLGVDVEFIEVDLAKFAAGLQADRYDVSIGPTFRTIPRAAAVDFTRTIFYLGYDGIVRSGYAQRYQSEADIDQEGTTVAVKEGSAIHTYVDVKFTNAEVLVLSGNDLTLPLQAVVSGQADVGLMNEHTVEYFARANSASVEIVLEDSPIQVLGMSWAVSPNDHRWRHFLDTSLEALIATGKMAEFERTHYDKVLPRQLTDPAQPTSR